MVPKVSILLPAYNQEKYIEETVESILSQTFTDFEFIILDDASSDRTAERIQTFEDERITFYQNAENLGSVGTLNKGLALCRGEYIARIDGDDIAYPDRLAKQVAFLDSHPDVGVVGSAVQCFSDSGMGKVMRYETDSAALFSSFLLAETSMVAHPAVMMRRCLFEGGIQYSQEHFYAEDYKLWNDLKWHTRIANMSEVLLKYRIHQASMSRSKPELQANLRTSIAAAEYERFLGEDVGGCKSTAREMFASLSYSQLVRLVWGLQQQIGMVNALKAVGGAVLRVKVIPPLVAVKHMMERMVGQYAE
ncbi:glycosyltransferase family 2 protein [Halodesulfovibrio spirochaetisodalis]|uniref:glycosyltransferase family 2 protein n=1 Tax=Halodesulfovibrio spirochaetisodalis TaxID=1560234 RepID=UPI00082B5F09|nr:glycosyltransferase family A protein [Halodesulfovibrio spirochaetisodalis]